MTVSESPPLLSFTELRALAETSSHMRSVIQQCKTDIRGRRWRIEGGSEADREQATAFFARPDMNYFSLGTWLDSVVEEVLVTDALSFRVIRNERQPFGVGELMLLDGKLIRPCLTVQERIPSPPLPAYRQFLKEVPRVDIVTTVQETDLPGLLPGSWRAYTAVELLYVPYGIRAWTAFGFPLTERFAQAPEKAHTDSERVAFFLKKALFDHMIQGVFGCAGMEWVW